MQRRFWIGLTVLLLTALLDCKQTGLDDDSESHRGEEIQSIVFAPESSDGKVYVHHYVESDGSFTPLVVTMDFEILPVDMVDKLVESWESSLSLEVTYTYTGVKVAAAGDSVSIPISDVSASDGRLTLTASAEGLDESFFKGELSAYIRLVINYGAICKSSECIPMVPFADEKPKDILNIPDANFKKYLVDNYDTDGDGEISADEALAVTSIDVSSFSVPILSLSGIERFSNLRRLVCSENKVESLDLRSNLLLGFLDCTNNCLKELYLPNSARDVYCSGNRLSSLDVSNVRYLRDLNCSDNDLEEINLQNRDCLRSLKCVANPVRKLVLDNCKELCELNLNSYDNAVTDVDEPNSGEYVLYRIVSVSGYNQATSFEFSIKGTIFRTFNFTDAPAVTSLVIDGDLTTVDVSGNKSVTSVDVSKLSALEHLNVSGCALTGIDLSNNTALKELNISDNAVSSLDVSRNSALEDLNVSGLGLSELDLADASKLKALDLTGTTNLTKVRCPSLSWLRQLNSLYDDCTQYYVDIDGNVIDGGPVVVIDGVEWSRVNIGSTRNNYPGTRYSIDSDVLLAACPEGWRLPTADELDSLSDNFSSVVTLNGVKGRWFTGSVGPDYESGNFNPYYTSPAMFLPSEPGVYCSSEMPLPGYCTCLYFTTADLSQGAPMFVGIQSVSSNSSCHIRCVRE